MNSNEIVNLYKRSTKLTVAGAESRRLFHTWSVLPVKHRLTVFDTETTGVIFHEPTILKHNSLEIRCPGPVIFGISLALDINGRIILVWARIDTELYDDVCSLLNKPSIKVAHNARYDIRMAEGGSISINGLVDCTQTMSRIINDRRKKHSLQKLSETWCPELSDWEEPVKAEMTRIKSAYTRAGHPKGYANYSFLPDELMCPYSMMDSFMCLIGYKILWPAIKSTFLELYKRERKVYYIISKIEKRGLAFNAVKAKKEAAKLTKKIDKSLSQMEGLNPNSPAQVLNALRGMRVKDRDLTYKGKVTTGADVLRELQNKTKNKKVTRFIDSLLLHRAYTKTVSTYLLPLTKCAEYNNGIVYTSINPTDTRTGRMASRNPNLHNIPTLNPRRGRTSGGVNPVRSCFVCRPGYSNYFFDYSQMEIVLFGAYTDARIILDTYNAGGDVHEAMAKTLYGKNHTKIQRDRTKDTNYGIIFGMGIQGIAKYRACTMKQARQFLDFYYETFDSIRDFQDECKQRLQLDGYVEDWFGKRYYIPVGESYKAVNALVQGGCAQIFKIGLLETDKLLNDSGYDFESNILLPVHDELIIESRVADGSVRTYDEKFFAGTVILAMTDMPQLREQELELRVDVSKTTTNWAEKEKLEA